MLNWLDAGIASQTTELKTKGRRHNSEHLTVSRQRKSDDINAGNYQQKPYHSKKIFQNIE